MNAANQTAQMWERLEDQAIFSGKYPEDSEYSEAAHLHQVVTLLGEPP